MRPWVGISLMPEADFIESALPLFQNSEIDVIEWSFDTLKSNRKEPEWLSILLNDYSKNGRLIGHGVRYSLLDARWGANQTKWLQQLSKTIKKYNYRHITEHFGFMTSSNFHKGAPLPVPLNKTTLAIGQDRLKRLQNVAGLNVGIENLAFAFSEKQVKEQGEFLEKLIMPINGFLILDLHNIWCQSVNFKIDALALIKSYPLNKVKEIHVSGGSWATVSTSKNKVRRDTHDEAVPKQVFDLLKQALPLCKNLECVIFERLGNTITTLEDKRQFIKDFRKIKKIVSSLKLNEKLPNELFKKIIKQHPLPKMPLENEELKRQQQFIIKTLSKNTHPNTAMQLLKNNTILQNTNWNTPLWTDYMVETAISLMKKWS